MGAIIPNLLTADRSVLCIDPKGENARITARARSRFGQVYVLDPFEISGQPSAAFNPLTGLDPDSLDLAEDAALLAAALVHDPPGQVGEADWNEEAKALIAGLILYVVCEEPAPTRTLATVRELLTLSPADFAATLKIKQETMGAGGLIRRAANRHLGKSEREASGVLSSAQRHTHFLDSARINLTMASSDFGFADLKEAKATVFLRHIQPSGRGWCVADTESAALFKPLFQDAADKHAVCPGQLTLHADRGPSMKAKATALMLADLGVTKSHSRPYTSNDNPFSESHFKTLKYRSQFPKRFGSIQDAKTFCRHFFNWCNRDHHHLGIGLMTPNQVHYGQVDEVYDARQKILHLAFEANPERFVNKTPQPSPKPTAVWINPPTQRLAVQA